MTTSICKKLAAGFLLYILAVFAGLTFLSSTAHASVSTSNPHYDNWSKQRDVIVRASVRAGVDPSDMAATAFIESKFDASHRRGLFQFEQRTWASLLKAHGAKYGLSRKTKMNNPMANALMAAELWKTNRGILTSKLHRKVTPTEVYIAHFLGAGGASAMLKANPNRLARDVTPTQARSNRAHFYNKGKPLTVAQFKAKMSKMVNTPKRTFGSEALAHATMQYDYAKFSV